MGRGESFMANQTQNEPCADSNEHSLSDGCSSGDRNTDRLRRNRESAKRCRLRRKENIHGVETKCKTLESQNENLTKENAHLKALVEKLLAASGHPEDVELQVSPSKRIKIEEGVTSADFTNESAATRSLQQEIVTYPLVTVTTFLFLMASTLLASMDSTHLAAVSKPMTTQAPLTQALTQGSMIYNKTASSGSRTYKSLTPCYSKHHLPVRWPITAVG